MAVGCASNPGAKSQIRSVLFNEHFIEQKWDTAGVALPRSAQGRPDGPGFNDTMLRPVSDEHAPNFDDPASMIEFVLRSSPIEPRVFPSERYYYYQFILGPRHVSGNLRFTDIELGVLHAGYFDVNDQEKTGHTSLRAADGLEVSSLGAGRYRVQFRGITREFQLVIEPLQAPTDFKLEPGEEFISGVLDESGVPLLLLWSESASAFYFVLDERWGSIETLVPLEGAADAYLAYPSRFVFVHDRDAGRKLLVGVPQNAVSTNSYSDGPFDQVPPKLPLKEKLERAYPYVKLRGGIDDHGNFRDMEASRVAISPYLQYATLDDVTAWVNGRRTPGLTGQTLWASLTYETKRDFHKQIEAAAPQTLGDLLDRQRRLRDEMPHMVYSSQGWPANHDVTPSHSWPQSHTRELSQTWPRDHEGSKSSAETQSQK
jgi:hypothetical protein